MRKTVSLFLAMFTAFAVTVNAGPPSKSIVVQGLDDETVDRQNIQDAVDAAGKNYTVELVGTFQLDGVPIDVGKGFITIAGARIDNDGDGAVNEDWPDGLDNDGDGAVDEDGWDAVLKGILAPDGTPDRVLGAVGYNRGLLWDALPGTTRNITVRDIEFSGLERGVAFSADALVKDGFLCDDLVVTDGSIVNSTVKRNHFTNSVRGFQIFGASDHVTVRDNLATRIRHSSVVPGGVWAVLLVGEASFCWETDGSGGLTPSFFEIGVPRRTRIHGNAFESESRGIGGFAAPETTISGNEVTASSAGPSVGPRNWAIILGDSGLELDSDKSMVSRNTITDSYEGITIGSDDSHVLNNIVLDSAGTGIVFFGQASGNKVIDNLVEGFGFQAIFLAQTTSGNLVRLNGLVDPADVTDLGTDNDVK